MLSKGNVSLAVESLIQKGLLKREQDGADRRRIHLHPTPAAAPIMVSLEDVRVQDVYKRQIIYQWYISHFLFRSTKSAGAIPAPVYMKTPPCRIPR